MWEHNSEDETVESDEQLARQQRQPVNLQARPRPTRAPRFTKAALHRRLAELEEAGEAWDRN